MHLLTHIWWNACLVVVIVVCYKTPDHGYTHGQVHTKSIAKLKPQHFTLDTYFACTHIFPYISIFLSFVLGVHLGWGGGYGWCISVWVNKSNAYVSAQTLAKLSQRIVHSRCHTTTMEFVNSLHTPRIFSRWWSGPQTSKRALACSVRSLM